MKSGEAAMPSESAFGIAIRALIQGVQYRTRTVQGGGPNGLWGEAMVGHQDLAAQTCGKRGRRISMAVGPAEYIPAAGAQDCDDSPAAPDGAGNAAHLARRQTRRWI
ncbi:hypothetical protein A8B78_11950 [Jannaschia sp. EhC01]|nr:hypothetical protein A8B78_11950 [Jannaschia sp. EhC01]